ncbi:hypothetical protein KIH45_14585 [Croceicoccus sp. 1NDH52]|nr:hypothetical protein [Croceicoccus gelatinilyticus]
MSPPWDVLAYLLAPRPKAAMIFRAKGNIRAIQILLEHTKIENTVRYLGVNVEDTFLLAELTEI